jgi:hypothetical protein
MAVLREEKLLELFPVINQVGAYRTPGSGLCGSGLLRRQIGGAV